MSEPAPPPIQDRLLASFRALVRGEFPQYTYLGLYEYSIQSTDGKTITGDPVDTSIPLPSIAKVPMRPSTLGSTVTPTTGSRCLVAFVNGDPTRPICISVDGPPSTANVTATGTLNLGGGNMPMTEHVATIEGVVTMLVSLLYVIGNTGGLGNPSTWIGVGKIFDVTDPTMTVLNTTIATLLTGCNTPLPPTPTTMGGVMPPLMLLAVEAQIAAKLPDVLPGLTPFGIGAPNVMTG